MRNCSTSATFAHFCTAPHSTFADVCTFLRISANNFPKFTFAKSADILVKRGGQDTESAKAKEERDEEGGERELGPGKDAEFRESQETMRWQEMKKL